MFAEKCCYFTKFITRLAAVIAEKSRYFATHFDSDIKRCFKRCFIIIRSIHIRALCDKQFGDFFSAIMQRCSSKIRLRAYLRQMK